MASTEEQVIEILSEELCVPAEDISLESRIVEDMDADSLDQIEIMMTFEEIFGLEFPEEEVINLNTVGEIVDYMDKRLKRKK